MELLEILGARPLLLHLVFFNLAPGPAVRWDIFCFLPILFWFLKYCNTIERGQASYKYGLYKGGVIIAQVV